MVTFTIALIIALIIAAISGAALLPLIDIAVCVMLIRLIVKGIKKALK